MYLYSTSQKPCLVYRMHSAPNWDRTVDNSAPKNSYLFWQFLVLIKRSEYALVKNIQKGNISSHQMGRRGMGWMAERNCPGKHVFRAEVDKGIRAYSWQYFCERNGMLFRFLQIDSFFSLHIFPQPKIIFSRKDEKEHIWSISIVNL